MKAVLLYDSAEDVMTTARSLPAHEARIDEFQHTASSRRSARSRTPAGRRSAYSPREAAEELPRRRSVRAGRDWSSSAPDPRLAGRDAHPALARGRLTPRAAPSAEGGRQPVEQGAPPVAEPRQIRGEAEVFAHLRLGGDADDGLRSEERPRGPRSRGRPPLEPGEDRGGGDQRVRRARWVDAGGPNRVASRTTASSSGRVVPSRNVASTTAVTWSSSSGPAAVARRRTAPAPARRLRGRRTPKSSCSFDGNQ